MMTMTSQMTQFMTTNKYRKIKFRKT